MKGGDFMPKKVYANLLGNWTDITVLGTIHDHKNPLTYIQESLDDLFDYDYVNIQYNNVNYRIHPSMIQIIND